MRISVCRSKHASTVSADEVQRTFSVIDEGRLAIDFDSGDIVVRSGDESVIDVTITRDGTHVKRMHVNLTQISDREVRVVGDLKGLGLFGRGRTTVDITVPSQFTVEVSTGGGRIDISGISGPSILRSSGGDIEIGSMQNIVTACTSGGDIRVESVIGHLALETSGGDIQIATVRGDLDGKTSGGLIEVNEATGRSVLRSSGGSIRIGSAESVDIDAGGGNVLVSSAADSVVAKTSGSIDVAIVGVPTNDTKLESSGGEVTLAIADGISARIHAVTSGGQIQNQLPGFVVDTGHVGKPNVRGRVGTGNGPLMELWSSGGDLTIAQHDVDTTL